ncbi:MAG: hypothetical protein ACRC1I_25510, partial [Pseudomonas proteolytica]|uniref:hypothetical protein n=1 Tax=Pseudomonas proteolytica TaxID=219574 RepID=UPI003F3B4002
GSASASRQTGISQGNINEVCTGKRASAGGYVFKYASDLIQELQAQLTESQRREKAAVEDLKYYLEINEENGVVFIPKFAVEKIINQSGPQAGEESK